MDAEGVKPGRGRLGRATIQERNFEHQANEGNKEPGQQPSFPLLASVENPRASTWFDQVRLGRTDRCGGGNFIPQSGTKHQNPEQHQAPIFKEQYRQFDD